MAAAQENRTTAIRILINEGKCDKDATTSVVCLSTCVHKASQPSLSLAFVLLCLLSTGRVLCHHVCSEAWPS